MAAFQRSTSIHEVLPVELLIRILLLSIRPQVRYMDTVRLSNLGRRIREIVLSSPEFWTSISIASPEDLPLANLYLVRSRECLVDCTIAMTQLLSTYLADLRSFLQKCHLRMRSLTVTEYLYMVITDISFPRLQKVTLAVGITSVAGGPTVAYIPPMPQIRDLTLIGPVSFEIPTDSVSEAGRYCFSQLMAFTLDRARLHRTHYRHLSKVLEHAPSLKHISFCNVQSDESGSHSDGGLSPAGGSPAILSNISHFTFLNSAVRNLGWLFNRVDTSRVQIMELGDFEEPEYKWLVEQKFVLPSVRRYVITTQKTRNDKVFDVHGFSLTLVQLFPFLQELEIPYWRAKVLVDWLYHFPPPKTKFDSGIPERPQLGADDQSRPWSGVCFIRITKEPVDNVGMELMLSSLLTFAKRSKETVKAPLRIAIDSKESLNTPFSVNTMRILEGIVGTTRL